MASRRPETIAKREKEQARREKRERKQAKKDARALGELPMTDENGEPIENAEQDESGESEESLDDVQLDPDAPAGEPVD
jgi:hypothetical protein